jgi:hypothetical protein
MARYEIELDDESLLEADDARFVANGRFIELIPRKATASNGLPERVVLNAAAVRAIHVRPIGFKGGWRLDGSKDSSFEPTEGSI